MPLDQMSALLRANMRAGEIREAGMLRHPKAKSMATEPILRGAPTHSCAHLLNALDELGWELAPKRYKEALQVIASPNRATYEKPGDAVRIATQALHPDA